MKNGKWQSKGKSFHKQQKVVRKGKKTLCLARSKKTQTKNGKVLKTSGNKKWVPCKKAKKAKTDKKKAKDTKKADKKPKKDDKKKAKDTKKKAEPKKAKAETKE